MILLPEQDKQYWMKMILLVSDGTQKYYWCGKMLCHTYMARRPNKLIAGILSSKKSKTFDLSI
jgi:hypothetical protein